MLKEYRILEFEKGNEFQDFGNPIIVRIVEVEKYNEYKEITEALNWDRYNEISQYYHWLLFKPTGYRIATLVRMYHDPLKKYNIWLDLENDFELIKYPYLDPDTGEMCNINAFKVKMISPEMDIVEFKERGLSSN